MQNVSIDRRNFLKASGIAAAATTLGTAAAPALADEVAWDFTYDVLIIGGGCAGWAAIVAAEAGASVGVVDKGNSIGGTTAFSGNGMWVPNNDLMTDFLDGSDYFNSADTDEDLPKALEYALAANAYGEADPELAKDYVYNINTVVRYLKEKFDDVIEYRSIALTDYYMLDGAKYGRGVGFQSNVLNDILLPKCEQYGVELHVKTEATKLVVDEAGRVVGAIAVDADGNELAFKGEKGVLLNTGSFEHNEAMRKAYLRNPIMASNSIPTNTGDGHRMAAEVGADFGNMGSYWGVPFYKTSDDPAILGHLCDWLTWRVGDHSIIVNKYGKRFGDETMAYAPSDETFFAYDSKHYGLSNIPGFQIGDQSFVELYNYPGVSDSDSVAITGSQAEGLPNWVKLYDSIEELAVDNGIDPEALAAEIERWNAFCEAGADEDFGRELNRWKETYYFPLDEANPKLGKIETPPFFCAEIIPGTCGSNGGVRVNMDAQALRADGSVIEGLYASGNCSAAYFGSAYPGPGTTVGGGIFRGVRAINHILDLGIF